MQGTVKWFDADKGYGFIKPDVPASPDVFVHVTALDRAGIKDLAKGQRLEFRIGENRRTGKTAAVDLVVLEKV